MSTMQCHHCDNCQQCNNVNIVNSVNSVNNVNIVHIVNNVNNVNTTFGLVYHVSHQKTFWTFFNLFVFSREISEGRQQPSNSLMYGRISKYSDFSLLKRNLRRTTKTLKDQTKYPHCFILFISNGLNISEQKVLNKIDPNPLICDLY